MLDQQNVEHGLVVRISRSPTSHPYMRSRRCPINLVGAIAVYAVSAVRLLMNRCCYLYGERNLTDVLPSMAPILHFAILGRSVTIPIHLASLKAAANQVN